MLRHKNIDRMCCIVLAVTLVLSGAFVGAAATGRIQGGHTMGYENRLFDQSRVHTIDLFMEEGTWEEFLASATSEEYSACTIVIDGERFGSAAIRGKGNTSLSSVQAYGNNRYSFKVEFDHYQTGRTYYGLDKLSLNNLIQDNTCLKDYVSYTLMNRMGVAAPLCSFVQVNVDGEYWGLYLAVEGVEDAFLQRNYGSVQGELYKPDSMSFGGGRGNGRNFDMAEMLENLGVTMDSDAQGETTFTLPQMPTDFSFPDGGFGGSAGQRASTSQPTATPEPTAMPAPTATPAPSDSGSSGGSSGTADGASSGMPAGEMPMGGDAALPTGGAADGASSGMPAGEMPTGGDAALPTGAADGASSGMPAGGFDPNQGMASSGEAAGTTDAPAATPTAAPSAEIPAATADAAPVQPGLTMPEGFQMPEGFEIPKGFQMPDMNGGNGGDRGFGGGMGSDDVKLVYSDDDPESYANIFNNAKTDVTEADQARLIASLKALNEGDVSVVDTEAVIRYMAVHNFLCNDDSYTGVIIHNYYLYEEDGVLSMIPWDYNLAFGGQSMGFGGSGATSLVNSSIDSLVSNGGGDRPMADWITASAEYTARYHEVYQQFMDSVFGGETPEDSWFAQEFDRVTAMIAPYVESDPTAFCTYEEFQQATATLRSFCLKRAESIQSQLAGTNVQVDASDLELSDMGGMGNTMGGGMGGGDRMSRGSRGDFSATAPGATGDPAMMGGQTAPGGQMPNGQTPPTGEAAPGTTGAPAMMGGQTAPGGQMPNGQTAPTGEAAPGATGDPVMMGGQIARGEQPSTEPAQDAQPTPAATADDTGSSGESSGSSSGQASATETPAASAEPATSAEPGGIPAERLTQADMPADFDFTNMHSGAPGNTSAEAYILLAICGAVLLAGLLLAGLYRSKR